MLARDQLPDHGSGRPVTGPIYSHYVVIAERRERSERSEANNRVLFEIPRYLYIYIYIYIYVYIYVCLQVHCARACTPYASPITSAIVYLEHWLLFGALL